MATNKRRGELDRRTALEILAALATTLSGVGSAVAGDASSATPLADGQAALSDMTSGRAWKSLLEMLGTLGPKMQSQERAHGALEKTEAIRFLLRNLDHARLTQMELYDPGYPQIVRLYNTHQNYGDTNPDCAYCYARVSPDYTYRIHGTRGSARILDVQCIEGDYIQTKQRARSFLSNIQGDNGQVEILLSAKAQKGNWVKLDDGVRWIYIRQYYYDWENEVPADLAIERVGAKYPPPPPTAEALAIGLEQITSAFPGWCAHILDDIMGRHYRAEKNDVYWMQSEFIGMNQNHYGNGRYEFGPGEAVLLEFTPFAAEYWNIVMFNVFGESSRWDVRQTSLNGHQAVLDPDGVYRFVISDTDPGIPNWLDTEGRREGLYTVRVLRPTTAPGVTQRVIPLKEIRRHLHPTTARVTAAARSEALRRRMLGVARRFRA